MSMVLATVTVLGIALALFLLYKFIFLKKKQETKSAEMASEEVLDKEVSKFDHKTGKEKEAGTGKSVGNEGNQVEKSDDNKEIR